MELVPIHTPRPLRNPLRGEGLGCLRTRAMAPAYSCHSLRDGMNFRLRGGIGPLRPTPVHWSPYTAPDLCAIPSGVEGLGAFAPAQSRELRGVEIEIPPYLPYPICDLLRVSARAVKCSEQ